MEHSQAERLLFEHFEQEFLLESAMGGAYLTYAPLIHLAFTHPERYLPNYIAALRAAIILMDEKPCRMSEEFDKAILDQIDGFIPKS